jgi:septal ring factor EnvC (AmiA/AmiB activator)
MMEREYTSRNEQPMMRWCWIVAVMVFSTALGNEPASLDERQARLETLRKEIGEIGERIAAERDRAGGVEAELARLEQRIGDERRALAGLDEQIQANAAEVAELESAVARETAAAQQHRAFLAATIRSAYRRGQADMLRLLLGENDPAEVQRLLVYQRHLGAARAQRLAQAQDALQSLQARRTALSKALDRQRTDREARAVALATLQSSLGEREALLADIEDRIERGDAQIASRREEAASLARLIEEIEARLGEERLGAEPPDLPARQGELDWPLEGPLLARYGSQRADDLQWTGLLIGAEAGTEVTAPAAGRVVFSDWLRGMGLLLIIDHGNGFMSLYGRNQALYFEVGEAVRAGDVIATVGRSGGRHETALYFELRADGEPIDPVAWLQTGGHQT